MPFYGLAGANQLAVYWPKVGVDVTGMPAVDTVAQELEVLWDDTHREVQRSDGTTVAVDATVSALPCEPLVGSAFAKGSIDDLLGANQTATVDVMRVVHTDKTPDFNGRDYVMTAYLMRSSDKMLLQA